MSRPSDHFDSAPAGNGQSGQVVNPKLGFVGSLRWLWTQLTSMRTALVLLLLLAIAAIPGSLLPQRAADPNGVTQYFDSNKDLAPILDKLQLFDVYSSSWFSAIYLLLFISLIGCVLPRTKHHFDALRAKPPRTPARLERLPGFAEREFTGVDPEAALASATKVLKSSGYRVARYDRDGAITVSAERGYMRETGNLVFHFALVGVLIAVGFGGGFGYNGQRVITEGQGFSNTLLAYDSFNPGRFFNDSELEPFSLKLDKFKTTYEEKNSNALGQATDYLANVTAQVRDGKPFKTTIKVNEPLAIGGTNVYLLGNGYAPVIKVTSPSGKVVFNDAVPFLPQDKNLTSLGVVKLPDGLPKQVGLVGFFYPTAQDVHGGMMLSIYPDLVNPMLTFNVYVGDLGLNEGVPRSIYALDTSKLTKLTGINTTGKSLEMKPGQSAVLPNGMGTVTFEKVVRYVSLDVHHDPTQGWVLFFALAALAGLLTSLFIPRRRMWVSIRPESKKSILVEYAALARGDDPTLDAAVQTLISSQIRDLGLTRD
jgi:cytochrome c biogenesis protein